MEEKKEKKRKSRKRPSKRRIRPRFHAAGGGISRPAPNYRIPSYNQHHNDRQEVRTKVKEDRWNGNSEIWSKPILPKQEKIVKHEIDTEKLLEELSEENEKSLSKLSEQIEQGIESLKEPLATEGDQGAEAKVETLNNTTSAPAVETEEENGKTENEVLDSEEANIEELFDAADEKIENSDYETTIDEAVEAPEPSKDLAEQTPQENEYQDFGAELILFNPDFWREIGIDLWNELEQIEPEIEAESPQESEAMQ